MKRRLITSMLVTGLSLCSVVQAQNASGRLDRIRDTQTLVLAYSETAVPFSYVDATGPKGYGVDLSLRIAQAIQQELGLKKLTIRWNPVTLTTRFPLMVTNTVDLGCITTTHTREREQFVGFSTTFHVAHEGIVSRADAGIQSVADLGGKRIAVVRDTTTEAGLRAQGLGEQLNLQRNNRRAMAELVEGRADAYVAAASLAAAELAQLPPSAPLRLVATEGGREAYACFLPKGDAAFKAVVDRAITATMRSGDMAKLYSRWFEQPIPGVGRALGMPLGADDRALFESPNDTPLQ